MILANLCLLKGIEYLFAILFVISDTYFLVQWKDEGSHSVISTRELQEPSSAPYLKEGSDIKVKVLEKKTKKIYSAVVLASGEDV